MLNSVFSFIVALGILVFIHEYGHYAVARYFKVRVIRFSVGFGRPLLKWMNPKTQVEWTVSWIPLGGFVRMLDERDPESLEGANINLDEAFNRKPVMQRIAIVLAGPLANLLLASLLYSVLAYSLPEGIAPKLGLPTSSSLAANAGVQLADEVVQVNGDETKTWSALSWSILKARLFRDPVVLTVKRGGMLLELSPIDMGQVQTDIGPNLMQEIGLRLYEKRVLVRNVQEGSPAALADFQVNDVLLSVNGQSIYTASDFTTLVQPFAGRETEIALRRNGVDMVLQATPVAQQQKDGSSVGRLGLSISGETETVSHVLGGLQALEVGVHRMLEVSLFSLAALGKMITGDLSWHHLSGPVSIASAAGESSSLGILPFVSFLAMVSVSLGILNLLPIPLLDGGHLMYYLAELIRGCPVSEKAQMLGQRLGMALIAGMTIVALFNDIQKLL